MKHELNSQSTKQMLCDALIELSAKKSFSKITISEIVNLCNVNRKTFYYHFEDVYDLLEWHLSNEINKAVSDFFPPSDEKNSIDFSNFERTIDYAMNYMNQHPYLQKFVQDVLAREKITKLLHKNLSPLMSEHIEILETAHAKNIDAEFREFLVKNFTHIIVLSILDAIENPNNYDIEKIKHYLSNIFHMSIHGFFEQI